MDDACYLCRRTQVDLDRLNEEIRTRVYLSYFSNARGQLDEQRRRITFLQRLKDEESGDPHFRISARQVFGDPMAYKKLMPWIETLMEIANAIEMKPDDAGTIGALVDRLLAEQHGIALKMEEGLNRIRGGFAASGHSPLSLEVVTHSFPVEWSVDGDPFAWRANPSSDREPLRRLPGASKSTVEVQLHVCSACQKITAKP
ncbi:MAG: hypothetical protein ACLQD8_08375 [Thermoplasmata archaeon]